jgi:hypothetical protein
MDAAYCAWQHQQKRIDELEASIKFWQENSVDLEYKCLDKNLANDTLQAKLNVAVNALEFYTKFSDRRITETATEALAEINKIGE